MAFLLSVPNFRSDYKECGSLSISAGADGFVGSFARSRAAGAELEPPAQPCEGACFTDGDLKVPEPNASDGKARGKGSASFGSILAALAP